jgi:hypothetical protein
MGLMPPPTRQPVVIACPDRRVTAFQKQVQLLTGCSARGGPLRYANESQRSTVCRRPTLDPSDSRRYLQRSCDVEIYNDAE